MSSTIALQSRLKELSAALGHIHPLVGRLRNFTTSVGQGDEARLELGAEIHSLLKEAEEQMELLKVEVDALETGVETKRKGQDTEKEAERERVVVLAGRLTEDLKRTRGDFRNAQLQAKRNAELAKRKERDLLFTRSQTTEGRKQSSEKLTQDEIVKNASSDVTAALRRTHQLMQGELSRSQFAQQTLEQSTAAISSLSESYTGLDTLLSSSRNLVGSLLRSQKSDTWYLETAFYILLGTIIWLLFRRILYGPMWWLVWLPLKLVTKFTFAILGAVGITSAASQSSASVIPTASTAASIPALETPGLVHETETYAAEGTGTGTAWEQASASVEPSDSDRIIDEIANMTEEINRREAKPVDDIMPEETNKEEPGHEETVIDDISPEEKARQDEIPRNPKKRMYEAVEENRKDEL
ncbi:hypothetical protein AWENTII_012595 [Aspergillus wentii]|nr:hypothetical protein MW887_002613 [Aspergillus wentii]